MPHRCVDFEEARGEVLFGKQTQVFVQYSALGRIGFRRRHASRRARRTNTPAALELVVIKVHHAVAAARDSGQELALANLLVRAVALGAHRRTLLRLALQERHKEQVSVSARGGARVPRQAATKQLTVQPSWCACSRWAQLQRARQQHAREAQPTRTVEREAEAAHLHLRDAVAVDLLKLLVLWHARQR